MAVNIKAPVKSTKEFGAYVGNAETDLSGFESTIGKKVNLLADFESWDSDFPTNLSKSVGQKGKTLVIFWEPSFGFDTINNGSQDDYIKSFAVDAKSYGYKVILAPFGEFNLNESDWGYGVNNNTPDKFISAWKHIHDLFAATGVTNVKFAWTLNSESIPNNKENQPENYYPGSDYVDYVAIDGFNFGKPWRSFDEIFGSIIGQVEIYHKPIYILSFASAEGPQKATWITDAITVQIPKYPNIKGWIWFNQNKEKDWRIWSDSNSLKAFKNAVD